MNNHQNIKRVLGFDFGMKRIGVAVGQTISQSASPLKTLSARDGVPNWDELDRLMNEWQPEALIVGLPLNMDGSKQPITFAAAKFAKKLRNRYELPVFEEDERLSTVEAKAMIFEDSGYQGLQKSNIDSMAAVVIIEQWLTHFK